MSDISKIENFLITDVSITMADQGCLTFYLTLSGGWYGCNFGGYCIGNGYLGADDFKGYAVGLECMMRIMDVVGVERWEDLKGKHVRAEWNGIGTRIHKIGNIIRDQWFDIDAFFKEADNANNQ